MLCVSPAAQSVRMCGDFYDRIVQKEKHSTWGVPETAGAARSVSGPWLAFVTLQVFRPFRMIFASVKPFLLRFALL